MRRGPTGVSETGPAAAPFCFSGTGFQRLSSSCRRARSSAVEQRTHNPLVPGSNPGGPTNESPASSGLSSLPLGAAEVDRIPVVSRKSPNVHRDARVLQALDGAPHRERAGRALDAELSPSAGAPPRSFRGPRCQARDRRRAVRADPCWLEGVSCPADAAPSMAVDGALALYDRRISGNRWCDHSSVGRSFAR